MVCKSGCIISSLDALLSPCTCFCLKSKYVVYTHEYWKYSSDGYLAVLITLGMTYEVFEFSQKTFPLAVAIETMYILVR